MRDVDGKLAKGGHSGGRQQLVLGPALAFHRRFQFLVRLQQVAIEPGVLNAVRDLLKERLQELDVLLPK